MWSPFLHAPSVVHIICCVLYNNGVYINKHVTHWGLPTWCTWKNDTLQNVTPRLNISISCTGEGTNNLIFDCWIKADFLACYRSYFTRFNIISGTYSVIYWENRSWQFVTSQKHSFCELKICENNLYAYLFCSQLKIYWSDSTEKRLHISLWNLKRVSVPWFLCQVHLRNKRKPTENHQV